MSEIKSLLPHNATKQEVAIEVAGAQAIPSVAVVATLVNPRDCPVELLPWLAWAFSVEEWDSAWPEERKRAAVEASIQIHRVKGTVQSVRDACVAAGFEGSEIIEGIAEEGYGGISTHTGEIDHRQTLHWAEYAIRITRAIPIAEGKGLVEVLENVAPVRCRLRGILFDRTPYLHDQQITYGGTFSHGAVT